MTWVIFRRLSYIASSVISYNLQVQQFLNDISVRLAIHRKENFAIRLFNNDSICELNITHININ
jgi:hypothetical protein